MWFTDRAKVSQILFVASSVVHHPFLLCSCLPVTGKIAIHLSWALDLCFYWHSMTCCCIKYLLQPQVLFKLIKFGMVLSTSLFFFPPVALMTQMNIKPAWRQTLTFWHRPKPWKFSSNYTSDHLLWSFLLKRPAVLVREGRASLFYYTDVF